MKRQSVNVTREYKEWFKAMARVLGLTQAEIVRRAVSAYDGEPGAGYYNWKNTKTTAGGAWISAYLPSRTHRPAAWYRAALDAYLHRAQPLRRDPVERVWLTGPEDVLDGIEEIQDAPLSAFERRTFATPVRVLASNVPEETLLAMFHAAPEA